MNRIRKYFISKVGNTYRLRYTCCLYVKIVGFKSFRFYYEFLPASEFSLVQKMNIIDFFLIYKRVDNHE